MAYTSAQLVAAYTAANNGVAPDAATTALLNAFAVQTQTGQMSDAAALSYVINSAQDDVQVAVQAYQFFTGSIPSTAGLDYLTNSEANTNDLNDAYYAQFNLENRYINFAANLGLNGEGAAGFASSYGSLSFAQFVDVIYETVIGTSYATAAGIDVAAAKADIASRYNNFVQLATERGMITSASTQAQIDLAVKASVVGYLMAEGAKADVGVYAAGANNYVNALINGNAQDGVNLLDTYSVLGGGTGSPVVNAPPTGGGVTKALTVNQDAVEGTVGNDTFLALNGTGATLTLGDVINGGAGTDTLKITSDAANVNLATATITNVENIHVDNSAAGLQAATAVSLDDGAYAKATIVGVTGNDGATDTLAVTDVEKTTIVELDDLEDVGTTITFNSVAGVSDSATVVIGDYVDNSAGGDADNTLTIAGIETLNLQFTGDATLDAVTAAAATTVNVTVGKDASATLANNAAIAAATAINIATEGAFSMNGTTADVGANAVFTVTGAGTADLGTLEAVGATVNASANSGGVTVVGAADTKTITGGSGADLITAGGATTVITAGAGNDTVRLGAVDFGAAGAAKVSGGEGTDVVGITNGALLDADYAANIDGFETLEIRGGTGTYNMSVETSLTAVQMTAALAGAVTLDEVAAGTPVTISGDFATGSALTYDLKTDTAADAMTLNLVTRDSAASLIKDGADGSDEEVTVTDFIADDIETLTVNASVTRVDADSKASGYVHEIVNATLADLTNIVVTGAASVKFTDIDSAVNLSKVDATAATGNVQIDLSTSDTTKGVTYLGGSGVDNVTASANGDLLVGNGGADAFTLGAGKDTVRLAADADSTLLLVDLDGNGTLDLSTGYDTVTNFATTVDKIELSSALGLASGDARSALTIKGDIAADDSLASAADIANALKALVGTGVDFFSDGATDRAVAVASYDDTAISDANDFVFAFIDSNADGNFTFGVDSVVKLAGITSVVITDFQFG